MEEDIVSHIPLYGDFFACGRRLDVPSIDCLTSAPGQVPWFIARLMSSAAELEGRSLVMSETSDHSQRYRPAGDKRPAQSVSEAEIRGTCNRLFVSGVNRITSYYSFAGLNDDALRRLNEWVGRCATMLTGGHQVADIAVLYPIESVWPKFQPGRHRAGESPTAARIESLYRSVADALYFAQRDFTFVDGRALAEARVESGALVHGNLRWRVVVLPGADTLPLAAWKNLARFVASGGVVIALGALPANSEREFPSKRVQALAREMFGRASHEAYVNANSDGGAGIFLPAGSEAILGAVLDGVLEPDVKITLPSPVRITHRRLDGHDVFFLINDSHKPWQGEAVFAVVGKGEQWDPATGRRSPAEVTSQTRLALEPYGAMCFRFSEARLPERYRITTGGLPALVCRPLTNALPILARGEFVRAELSSDSLLFAESRSVWRATGVLTKGQTDTFLFARLPYPQSLDLSEADCLILDTWIPDGQKTPNQLLMILHERDGGDFLANTGRSLGAAGHERTFIPLNRFQLAGWSKDSDGELDLRRVDEIRIGWGGYFGAESEKVEFSFALPQTGSVASGGKNISTQE
jgi:hypothetical protein